MAGDVAHLVESLPSIHETLDSVYSRAYDCLYPGCVAQAKPGWVQTAQHVCENTDCLALASPRISPLKVQSGTQESAFSTSSQMLVVMMWGTHCVFVKSTLLLLRRVNGNEPLLQGEATCLSPPPG